jgi:hypothetical protein
MRLFAGKSGVSYSLPVSQVFHIPLISEKIKLLIEAEIISLVPESEFFNRIGR